MPLPYNSLHLLEAGLLGAVIIVLEVLVSCVCVEGEVLEIRDFYMKQCASLARAKNVKHSLLLL